MSGWMLAFSHSLVWMVLAAILGVVVGLLIGGSRRSVDTRSEAPVKHESDTRTAGATATTESEPTATASTASRASKPASQSIPADEHEPSADDSKVLLAAAQARIEALTDELAEREGRGEIEYGRLEAAAIRALDEIIAADQSRIDALQDDLAEARSSLRDSEQHLAVNDRTFESLRAALAERDSRITHLDNQLTQLQRAHADLQIKEGRR